MFRSCSCLPARSHILLSASVGYAGVGGVRDGEKGARALVAQYCSFACASYRFILLVSYLSLIVGVGSCE